MNLVVLFPRDGTRGRSSDRLRSGYAVGLLQGYVLAQAIASNMAFAGDHPGIAYGAFLFGFAIWPGVLALVVGTLGFALRRRTDRPLERIVAAIASVLIAHTAWHWTLSRADTLVATDIVWPGLAIVLSWATFALVAVLGFLGLRFVSNRWFDPAPAVRGYSPR